MARWRYEWRRARVRWRYRFRIFRTRDGECLGCGYPTYTRAPPLGWDSEWVGMTCAVCGEAWKYDPWPPKRKKKGRKR